MGAAIQAHEPVRVRLGDISVSDTRVQTPVGVFPLRGTVWTVSNLSYVSEAIPTWAIVMTILTVLLCLIGLLFLLVKERRVRGAVQVSVQGPGLSYSAYLPVYNELAVFQVNHSVDWIRSQAARLQA